MELRVCTRRGRPGARGGVSVVVDIFGVEVGSGVLVRTGGCMEGTGVILTDVMCDCVLDAVVCEGGV